MQEEEFLQKKRKEVEMINYGLKIYLITPAL